MSRRAMVLVVEDDTEMRSLLAEELKLAGYEILTAANGKEAAPAFENHEVDVVVTDHMMPGIKGRDLLTQFRTRKPDVPVIIITAFGSIETAVDAMRGGAYHYLSKPFPMDQLLLTVASALRERDLMLEVTRLRDALLDANPDIVARSPAMRQCLALVLKAAACDMPVLLLGESGTGKELLARFLHAHSLRRDGRFLAVNCAAIPESLLESQLFGHRRGAFTDAREDRRGLLQESNGGTVLLDEIGDMPIALQAKILRVLQESEVHPLGAPAPVKVDVRVVAATNQDLGELSAQKRFREDLYYRLNVIQVRIPPLRERPEDIVPLVAHLIDKHGRRIGRSGMRVSAAALARLQQHTWPGNVRELENVVQRALVLSEDEVLGPEDLPDGFGGKSTVVAPPLGGTLAEVERQHILRILRAAGGNKAAAARLLGVDRKTLYRKLESLGVDTESEAQGPESPHM